MLWHIAQSTQKYFFVPLKWSKVDDYDDEWRVLMQPATFIQLWFYLSGRWKQKKKREEWILRFIRWCDFRGSSFQCFVVEYLCMILCMKWNIFLITERQITDLSSKYIFLHHIHNITMQWNVAGFYEMRCLLLSLLNVKRD